MFSIGEFARHGRVSVRMLRHYDAIGLIRPACVDAATGYRSYQASQLDDLNRVIALKDLGFTLQQVQAILEEKLSAAELRGMLRLRRAEIQATIDAETTRLARVEARLLTIEDGARVPADGVVVKRLAPALDLALELRVDRETIWHAPKRLVESSQFGLGDRRLNGYAARAQHALGARFRRNPLCERCL